MFFNYKKNLGLTRQSSSTSGAGVWCRGVARCWFCGLNCQRSGELGREKRAVRSVRITYLLIDEESVRGVRVAGQTGSGEDEQESNCRQSEHAHQQVGDDVDQVGPLLAGHDAHETAQYDHSSRPQTLKRQWIIITITIIHLFFSRGLRSTAPVHRSSLQRAIQNMSCVCDCIPMETKNHVTAPRLVRKEVSHPTSRQQQKQLRLLATCRHNALDDSRSGWQHVLASCCCSFFIYLRSSPSCFLSSHCRALRRQHTTVSRERIIVRKFTRKWRMEEAIKKRSPLFSSLPDSKEKKRFLRNWTTHRNRGMTWRPVPTGPALRKPRAGRPEAFWPCLRPALDGRERVDPLRWWRDRRNWSEGPVAVVRPNHFQNSRRRSFPGVSSSATW